MTIFIYVKQTFCSTK